MSRQFRTASAGVGRLDVAPRPRSVDEHRAAYLRLGGDPSKLPPAPRADAKPPMLDLRAEAAAQSANAPAAVREAQRWITAARPFVPERAGESPSEFDARLNAEAAAMRAKHIPPSRGEAAAQAFPEPTSTGSRRFGGGR